MKYEVYILSFSIVGLSIFGQVVLWFGQAKYTLYLSEGTSELKREFLALDSMTYFFPNSDVQFRYNCTIRCMHFFNTFASCTPSSAAFFLIRVL